MTVMDANERRRFIDTLRSDEQFRADVRRELLSDELLHLPQAVAALIEAVAEQRRDFGALTQQVLGLAEAVGEQRRDIGALIDAVAEQRRDFGTLIDAVAEQRRDFGTLTQQVRALTQGVADSMARTIAVIETGFSAVGAQLGELRSDVESQVTRLRSDVESQVTLLRIEMDSGWTAVAARFDQVDAALRELRG